MAGAAAVAPAMTKEEKKLEALYLAQHRDWTPGEISRYLGVNRETVRRWTDPEYLELSRRKDRARKESYGGTCLICGGKTTGSNGPGKAPKYCNKHSHLNPDRKPNPKTWEAEDVIAALKKWDAIYGVPPSSIDWNPTQLRNHGREEDAQLWEAGNWPWFSMVYRTFGSWNKAMEIAGFTSRPPYGSFAGAERRSEIAQKRKQARAHGSRRFWTREKILTKIHEWNDLYGSPPTSADWLQKVEFENGHRRWPSTGAVQDEFGSWSRGMRVAGFKPRYQKKILKNEPPVPPKKNWTPEEIIALMREWTEEHRLPPALHEWNDNPEYPSGSTVSRHFGSWNNAIRAAGFQPRARGLTAKSIKKLLPLPRKQPS